LYTPVHFKYREDFTQKAAQYNYRLWRLTGTVPQMNPILVKLLFMYVGITFVDVYAFQPDKAISILTSSPAR